MNRIVTIVSAASLLYAGIFSTPAFADLNIATVQASSFAEAHWPLPEARIVDSGVLPGNTVAVAKFFIDYEDPSGNYRLYADQCTTVSTAKILMWQQLIVDSRNGNGNGIVGWLSSGFKDKITVSKSGPDETIDLILTPVQRGKAETSFGTYVGNIRLRIIIMNRGSTLVPKDLEYTIRIEKS